MAARQIGPDHQLDGTVAFLTNSTFSAVLVSSCRCHPLTQMRVYLLPNLIKPLTNRLLQMLLQSFEASDVGFDERRHRFHQLPSTHRDLLVLHLGCCCIASEGFQIFNDLNDIGQNLGSTVFLVRM